MSVIIAPAPDDRGQHPYNLCGGKLPVGLQERRKRPAGLDDLLLLGLGQELPVGKASDVEAEEVEPVVDIHDAGLGFAQFQPPSGEEPHRPRDDVVFEHHPPWGSDHESSGVGVRLPRATRLVMGFETESDARRMMAALEDRLVTFGLSLHEDKTRLIEFGRLPALRRRQRGEQRCETFGFLGLTHSRGWTRDGRFIVKHKTERKRLTRKLKAL